MREELQKRIFQRVDALEKGYRQNIGIIGREGVGKTHLLQSFYQDARQRSAVLPIYIHIPSLKTPSFCVTWCEAVLMGLFASQKIQPAYCLESLMQAAEPLVPKTCEKIQEAQKYMRQEKWTPCLRELFSMVGTLCEESNKKVLILLDEFHDLGLLPVSDAFGLLGKEVMIEKNTLFLVTSSQPEMARDIFREKLSLLFSNFEILKMDDFTSEELSRFLRESLPDVYFPTVYKKFLLHWTQGRPAYVKILIRRLKEILQLRVRNRQAFDKDFSDLLCAEDLLEVIHEEFCQEGGRLSLLFQRYLETASSFGKGSKGYQELLMVMSQGYRKPAELASLLGRKTTDVKKMLARLCELDYVIKAGPFYMIEDRLFEFWLRYIWSRPRDRLFVKGREEKPFDMEILKIQLLEYEKMASQPLEDFLEVLLRRFSNESFVIGERKIQCPKFTDILRISVKGKKSFIEARYKNLRWAYQIYDREVTEDNVSVFMELLKKQKRIQKKVLIALQGIEPNAMLLAHEMKVQIWRLEQVNFLFQLYGLPRILVFPEEEYDEPTLGALAHQLHTA